MEAVTPVMCVSLDHLTLTPLGGRSRSALEEVGLVERREESRWAVLERQPQLLAIPAVG